jgi:Domain of unknown function (DUF4956)
MSELQNFFNTLSSGAEPITPALMVLALLGAFIGGQIVAWCYMWTHSGLSYSRSYVQSLVMIALVVTLVMIIVGTNVFVAFGLFGAFAVIRFRNVLKDTRDTAFVFMELAIGLAAGTLNFKALIIGVAAFVLVALYLSYTNFGSLDSSDTLIHLRAPRECYPHIEAVFHRHCQRNSMVSRHSDAQSEDTDWSWRVLMRDPHRADEFLEELRALEGVNDVSLLFQGDPLEA